MQKMLSFLTAMILIFCCLFFAACAEETEETAGLTPFLCFDWQDIETDAAACREMQPVHQKIAISETASVSYRLVLGKVQPGYVDGYLYIESGVIWQLESVWNVLTKAMTEAGCTSQSNSFSEKHCRISLQFDNEDTTVILSVMQPPGGERITFSCQRKPVESTP